VEDFIGKNFQILVKRQSWTVNGEIIQASLSHLTLTTSTLFLSVP